MMLTHHGTHGKLKLFHLEDGGFNHQRDYKNIQKLFALNKFLQNNSALISNETTKLLEEKIQKYTGNQVLVETKQPIVTLKHFATLKIVQNPDECSKHFPDTLPFPTIEMIEKLEQEYNVNLSGVTKES